MIKEFLKESSQVFLFFLGTWTFLLIFQNLAHETIGSIPFIYSDGQPLEFALMEIVCLWIISILYVIPIYFKWKKSQIFSVILPIVFLVSLFGILLVLSITDVSNLVSAFY